MIVGVYGVGYWIAGDDPYRHWPIVLVGFLGKAFGPVGFATALARGVFPRSLPDGVRQAVPDGKSGRGRSKYRSGPAPITRSVR